MAPPPNREIIARLPPTFRPALNDQFRQWDLLFPAEQRALQAQLDWLSRLPNVEFQRLFAPIIEIERQMDLPGWKANPASLTVQDTGVLARSPLYPRWRTEVERAFGAIDDALEAQHAAQNATPQPPRLVVCCLPAGLPLADQPPWPDLARNGEWVSLERSFGQMELPFTESLARRHLPAGTEQVESTWIWECEPLMTAKLESTGATIVSWAGLAAVRREFLNRLNAIRRDLNSVDQTNNELRKLDIDRLLGPKLGGNVRVRELVRGVLLSGNGSLVFSNSLVQWGASETLRRVQPRVLVARFGMREKLKPFSSAVLFEDQTKNELKEQDDPAGTLLDALMLSQYVHYSSIRQPAAQGRTMTVMAAAELDRVLLIGAPPQRGAKLSAGDLSRLALTWLDGAAPTR